MNTFTIRLATPSDLDLVAPLFDAYRQFYEQPADLALARERGKARMDLTTAKTNRTAQSVYESLGWTRDEVFYAYNKQING